MVSSLSLSITPCFYYCGLWFVIFDPRWARLNHQRAAYMYREKVPYKLHTKVQSWLISWLTSSILIIIEKSGTPITKTPPISYAQVRPTAPTKRQWPRPTRPHEVQKLKSTPLDMYSETMGSSENGVESTPITKSISSKCLLWPQSWWPDSVLTILSIWQPCSYRSCVCLHNILHWLDWLSAASYGVDVTAVRCFPSWCKKTNS